MAQDKVAEIIKFTGAGEPAAPAQPVAPPQPEEAEHAGAFLAAARAAAGLSVDAVSDAIKLKAEHVAAIEAMRADRLPAMPYAVGFVRTYARFLNLDADALAARFRAEIAGPAPSAAAPSPEAASEASAGHERARLVSVFAIFAIVLFALWVIVQVLAGAGNAPPAAQPSVRVTAPAPQPAAAPALAASAPEISATDSPPTEEMAPDGENTQAAAEGETAPQGIADDAAAAPAADSEAAPIPEAPSPATASAQDEPRETPPAATTEQTASETAPEAAAPQERPLPRRPRPAPPSRAPEVVEAALVRSPAPAYPDRCTRSAGALESVTIRFDVNAAGRAANARVVSSTNACFNAEALSALERWRFTPRTVDGEAATETGKSATLNFRK